MAVTKTNRFRRALYLIEADKWGRWVLLIGLALVVTAMEAIAALLIFVLLRFVTAPGAPVALPLLGDLEKAFPGVAETRIFLYLVIFIAGFFIVRAFFFVIQLYLQNRIAQNAGVRLAARLFRAYLEMPYSFHLQRNSAELIRNTFASASDIATAVFLPTATLVSEVLVIVGILSVLVISAPVPTVMTVLVLGTLIIVLMRVIHPRLLSLGVLSQEMQRRMLGSLQQSLQGIRDIKVLGREGFFQLQFAESRSHLARTIYMRMLLGESPRVLVETLLILFVLGFLSVTLAAGDSVRETLSVLGLFAYGAFRVLPSVNRVVISLNGLKFNRAAIDNVYEDLVELETRARDDANSPLEPFDFRDRIDLEGVTFRYPSSASDALVDINLSISRGESIGIVGPTGCGKSTLVDVILGMLSATSGRVLIDGVDLRGRERGWHSNIGMVSQTVFLLDDSIRRNIALGMWADEIDEDRVVEAARLSQLTDLIESLPDGFDSEIGERGVKLSGGQRQRIAIARALYREPSVLIFDEATAALDNVTEAALMHSIQEMQGERTIITVAHRLTTVRRCDRIVMLDRGRMIGIGSYDELVAQNAAFREMTS